MSRSRKLLLSTVIGSVLTAGYWVVFFYFAYALTAGDYRPGTGPSDTVRTATAITVWIAGVVVYSLLAALWRRIDFRLAGQRG